MNNTIYDDTGFYGLEIGEDVSFEGLYALAALLDEHGEAFAIWYSIMDGCAHDIDKMGEAFQKQFAGKYDSPEDWAMGYLELTDCALWAAVPKHLRGCLDLEAYARNAQLSGDIYFHRNHVFYTNTTRLIP